MGCRIKATVDYQVPLFNPSLSVLVHSPVAALMSASPFDANATLGVLEIAILTSSFIFGIITMQAYSYSAKFPHDVPFIKFLVGFIWSCELGHTMSLYNAFYQMSILEYGQPEVLARPPNGFYVSILFSGLIASLVQAFFADTIREKPYIFLGCWLLSFLRFLGIVVIIAEALKSKSFVQFEDDWRWLLTVTFTIGACNDITIAAVLCLYMKPRRSDDNSSVADFVRQVSAWGIENGLITSAVSVTLLISFLASRNTFIWFSVYNILTRLFANTLLSFLNSRPGFDELYHRNQIDVISNNHTFETVSTPRFATPSLKHSRPTSGYRNATSLQPMRLAPPEVHQETGRAI